MKGFFGATGGMREVGLREFALDEPESKRILAAARDDVYSVAKASGFGFQSSCRSQGTTALVTDEGLPEPQAAAWKAAGVDVRRAPLGR